MTWPPSPPACLTSGLVAVPPKPVSHGYSPSPTMNLNPTDGGMTAFPLAAYPKKSKDDPSYVGKHDLQWLGELFQCQHNQRHTDLAAMLGSIYLDLTADLCMANTPQLSLEAAWCFLPTKVAMPYLTMVCDHKDKGSTQSFQLPMP